MRMWVCMSYTHLNCVCFTHGKLRTTFPCVCKENDNDWIYLKHVEVMGIFVDCENLLHLDGVIYTIGVLA